MKRFAEFVAERDEADTSGATAPERRDDLEDLTRFVLMALRSDETFHQLLPVFHQIAGADKTGEMADLLHGLDWAGLREKAKEALKKGPGKDDEDDDTGPVKPGGAGLDKIDQFRPSFADASRSDPQ